ncbi:hypothetical protein [Amycolatopsis sp. cg13]|uniref:hypothetical protein n=1 Tax=Amycolatopsis sp. cg13 TaxID=3238807 RepID=UPI003525B22C
MEAAPERVEQLRKLLLCNGIELGDDDVAVQELNDWFRAGVESNPDNPERLRNLWYAVVNDVAMFLGGLVVSRNPNLHWALFTGGKRDVAFHKHVVMGFSKVANPKYNLDIDRIVATYAYQIIEGQDVDPEFFRRIMDMAAADA